MKIAILSKAPFPDGNASATYVLNVCRTMALCGHEVTVFGCRRGLKTDFPAEGIFEGIRYVNFDATAHNKVFTYLYDNCFGHYATRQLARKGPFDAAFLYGGTVSVAKTVEHYCRRKKIKFGAFNCEWYTEDCFSPDVSPRLVKETVGLIPYVAQKSDMAILISSLLTHYFREQGVHSVMIPNIVDLTDEKWKVRRDVAEGDVLKLAYAGVPGVGKDELGTVVAAIGELPAEQREKTQLHIYGPDEKGLLAYLKTQGIDNIPPYVVCHGRQKQDEIPARLNECHYTVLIRKPSLRANAGFSTKMVESFAAGIPMIANITGDIATYLRDGENGIVVADESVAACRDALLAAWTQLENNSAMRRAAYKTAEENFDYRQYKDAMETFLASCK